MNASAKLELENLLRDQQQTLTDALVQAQMAPPVPGMRAMGPDEIRQMVAGFFMLVREALGDGPTMVRNMYLNEVLPGLRDAGTPLGTMMGGSARFFFHTLLELVPRVSEANRAEARNWLVEFFSAFLGDAADVWQRR